MQKTTLAYRFILTILMPVKMSMALLEKQNAGISWIVKKIPLLSLDTMPEQKKNCLI